MVKVFFNSGDGVAWKDKVLKCIFTSRGINNYDKPTASENLLDTIDTIDTIDARRSCEVGKLLPHGHAQL